MNEKRFWDGSKEKKYILVFHHQFIGTTSSLYYELREEGSENPLSLFSLSNWRTSWVKFYEGSFINHDLIGNKTTTYHKKKCCYSLNLGIRQKFSVIQIYGFQFKTKKKMMPRIFFLCIHVTPKMMSHYSWGKSGKILGEWLMMTQ